MFSHKDDPESVRAVRRFQMQAIARWISAFRQEGLVRVAAWGDAV